ncbi:MAG TPA: GH1 family beta-glucosidase [Lacunisphaera sp.]|nr:GH1 family beta-glucosidase [Lacunisphaera sp.]
MNSANDSFPPGFVWGVASAAPQIEGAAQADGKGESVWDRFARLPGRTHNGDTLDVACDHYRRYPEDIALMRSLGVKHYRLSLAWPRIYPQGDGPLNQAGLDFYHRLFDALLEAGITPWVTLFHWDLPQALEDRGGWTEAVTVRAFARYADTVVQAFGSKVKHWITLNEIRCFTELAYAYGGPKAPGRREAAAVVNQTYHHALLCHGHAVRAVRQFGGPGARVGLTDNSDICVPLTETPADIAAARQWYDERNIHLLAPIYRGRYEESYLQRCGAAAPRVAAGDLALIGQPTDFLGLNIYTGFFVRAGPEGRPQMLKVPARYPRADSPWLNLMPQSIYWGARLAHETYGVKEIFITENGCGYDGDEVQGGEVNDLHRRDFIRGYLRELQRAIRDGVPVRGYFLWTLLDNFEWEDGYARRFGLVHVDFQTQRRTPKLSAGYYAAVMAANRVL